jgi:glycosyltransferase involved in cell wall biosynthesis
MAGGEFYIQRLARELKRRKKIVSTIICTDALDFAGVRGNGKKIQPGHRFFQSYQGQSVTRVAPLVFPQTHIPNRGIERLETREIMIGNSNIEFAADLTSDIQRSLDILSMELNVSIDLLAPYASNGPVYPPECFTDVISASRTISMVHCSYVPYLTLAYALLAARKYECPAVCTPFFHIDNPRYKSDLLPLLNQFDGIIACTHSEARYFIEAGISSEKIKVIPMGVDADRFADPTHQNRDYFFDAFPALRGLPSILFCGHKNYDKGAITLMRACQIVHKKKITIGLIMIGPPTEAFNHELAASKRMGLSIANITPSNQAGFFDRIKLGAFAAAKVYCMPSRSDAYGISFLEAWASRKPVVAADTPVMREIIPPEAGILVPFGDEDTLAQEIERLIRDPDQCERMGLAGHQMIHLKNQWDKIAEDSYAFYEELAR